MRLLPRTPRGTWLLAGAVWLAGVGALWWGLPVVPRAELLVPVSQATLGGFGFHPCPFSVRPDKGTVAVIGIIHAWMDTADDLFCGPVQILDFATARERRRYFSDKDTFHNLLASPDCRWLVVEPNNVRTGGNWSALVLLDPEQDRLINLPHATHTGDLWQSLAFLPDSSSIIYPCRRDGRDSLGVWDIAAGRVVREIADARAPVVVAVGGRALAYVATSNGARAIRVAEWPSLRKIRDLPAGAEDVLELSLGADGRRLAAILSHTVPKPDGTSTREKSVHCWDTTTGVELIRPPGDPLMYLSTDGETLVAYLWESTPSPRRIVAWDVSTEAVRWERDLGSCGVTFNNVRAAGLSDCATLTRSNPSPWRAVQECAERAGLKWPFDQHRETYSSELIDLKSGRSIMTLPFYLESVVQTPERTIAVSKDFEWQSGLPSRIQVWDIPPREPLSWFGGAAALLALPVFMTARRRVRRLRRAAAA